MRRILVLALTASLLTSMLTAPQPVAAGAAQGSLRAADPTLVQDGDTWVSLSTNESLSVPFANVCDPADPVWSKGFAYLPYRTGPAPDRLGDCYGGDVMPGGPGPWADRPPTVGMWLWAPSMAHIGNAWWLFYVARKKNSGQQCIGVAAGDRSTGPSWLHPAQPLLCPPNGSWAIDPEIFYDRQTQAWYLLWDSGALNIQRFDPATASLAGPVRALISESHPDVRFDEFGTSQVIENPTMVRADSGELWLFFSANAWASNNYATGWALCGRAGPTEGGGCVPINSLDPAGSRYRPWWGYSQRTAPVAGVNAKPLMAFPDLPGLGGMSVQGNYATAHIFWGGSSNLRTQATFKLDTSGVAPALYEPDVVTIHGRDGTFGSQLLGASVPSGQSLSTRAVPGWGWPLGHNGIFQTMTDGGALVVQGNQTDIADDMVVAGIYETGANQWSTVKAKTSKGFDTVASFIENGKTYHGGAMAWDVQALGDRVAFTNMFGVPWPSYLDRKRIPVEGVWPSFGIVAKVNGRWQVARQYSAAQLAVSNPDSDVDERACAPYAGLPDATSLCGGLNELALLPRSRDLIVALYAGDGLRTSGGLMAIRVNAQNEAKIVGYYAYPEVPDVNPPDPARPGKLGIAIKTVEVDPSSQPGDERFSVVADIWHTDNDGDPATIPPGLDPSVTQEFSYNSATGEIKPTSAPFIAGLSVDGTRFRGIHGGIYDHQGNMWTYADGMLVYSGGPHCPFDLNRWQTSPQSYTTTALGKTVWGQTCAPDYDIGQAKEVGGGGYFGNFLQLAEDPVSKAIVGVDTWDTGNVIAIQHAGTGRSKTFTVGQLVDTGRNLLPRQGPPEQRPPVFDKTGRMWFAVHIWPPSEGYGQVLDHWVVSVDVPQLFPPAALGLPRIQAEQTFFLGTRERSPRPDGVIPIDVEGQMLRAPGGGFMRTAGAVEYRVWAPAAGSYRLEFQVRGTGTISTTVGSSAYSTPVDAPTSWRLVTGPTVALTKGVNTIRLSGSGWSLDWFTLTK
ncbi:MAG TPA: family 43 glycosylhydrolase [Candidatus Limnocylindrales bacterium]|nr:family 43 glycosylhydrolase [Candidatus Limnocylindrales bacterium]